MEGSETLSVYSGSGRRRSRERDRGRGMFDVVSISGMYMMCTSSFCHFDGSIDSTECTYSTCTYVISMDSDRDTSSSGWCNGRYQ